jgi:hypothetical protein
VFFLFSIAKIVVEASEGNEYLGGLGKLGPVDGILRLGQAIGLPTSAEMPLFFPFRLKAFRV